MEEHVHGRKSVLAAPLATMKSACRSLLWRVRDRLGPDRESARAASRLSSSRTEGHFDAISGRYAGFYETEDPKAYFFKTRREIVRNLLDGLAPGGRALEVGCGPGLMADLFSGKGVRYSGVDVSSGMIAECRRLNHRDGVCFSVGTVEELDFPDEQFDVVLGMGLFEYVPRLADALDEIRRVIRADGQVVLSCLNRLSPYWIWQRAIQRPFAVLVSLLRGREVATPALRFFGQRSFQRLLTSRGFVVTGVVHHGFNLLPPPLDRRLPGLSVRISRWLEPRLRTSSIRRLSQSFVVTARRQAQPGSGGGPAPETYLIPAGERPASSSFREGLARLPEPSPAIERT